MRIPKKLTILGFNLCASIFVGFCVYGLLVYYEGGAPRLSASILSSLLFGGCIFACIAGICYFGAQWDRHNAEEARDREHPPASPGRSGSPPSDPEKAG